MSHVIILARTPREGQVYAREHSDELPRGRAIVPTSVSQISGVIPHLVIELPGFSTRPDRHAVLAAVKRSTKRYQDCEWRVIEAESPFVEVDGVLTTKGLAADAIRKSGYPNNERTHEIAARYDRLRDLETNDAKAIPAGDRVEQMRALAETADEGLLEQRKRRRSRCKDCGALHFADEPCVDPAASFGGE